MSDVEIAKGIAKLINEKFPFKKVAVVFNTGRDVMMTLIGNCPDVRQWYTLNTSESEAYDNRHLNCQYIPMSHKSIAGIQTDTLVIAFHCDTLLHSCVLPMLQNDLRGVIIPCCRQGSILHESYYTDGIKDKLIYGRIFSVVELADCIGGLGILID